MIFYMMKLLFVMIFLVSAISKILDFNNTLIYFSGVLKISLPVMYAGLWFLIMIELLVPVVVWMEKFKKPINFVSLQLLLLTFLIINIHFMVKGLDNCSCFGASIKSYPVFSMLKIIILMIILKFLKDYGSLTVSQARKDSPC